MFNQGIHSDLIMLLYAMRIAEETVDTDEFAKQDVDRDRLRTIRTQIEFSIKDDEFEFCLKYLQDRAEKALMMLNTGGSG
jgi:hypothetical protein